MFFGVTAVQAFLIILAIFSLLYWIIPQRYNWISFVVLTVLLSYMAFLLVPDTTDDLWRYYVAIDDLRQNGLDKMKEFIEIDQYDMKDYVTIRYLFWIVSRTNSNHWLQTIVIAFVYGSSSIMILLAQKRFQISRSYVYIGTMFFLSTYWYYDTASGIRNGLCFAIIVFCSYIMFVEKRFIPLCIIGYIIGFYTHSAGLLAVSLVVVTLVLYKFNSVFVNIVFMFSLIGGNYLVQALAENSDNSLILSIAGRAERHVGGDTLETGTMYRVNLTLFIIYILIIIFVSYYCKYGANVEFTGIFYKYCSIIMYFMIGAAFSGMVFIRFARWILPILGALVFSIGLQQQKNSINEKGETFIKYYSVPIEKVLYNLKPILMILVFAYSMIHLWYLCKGSSLYWAHFRYEWEAIGYYDYIW